MGGWVSGSGAAWRPGRHDGTSRVIGAWPADPPADGIPAFGAAPADGIPALGISRDAPAVGIPALGGPAVGAGPGLGPSVGMVIEA